MELENIKKKHLFLIKSRNWWYISHDCSFKLDGFSAVLTRGHAGQLPEGPTRIGAPCESMHAVYSIPFSCLNTDFVGNTNTTRAKRGVSPRLKILPVDLDLCDLWPWKSIGFQILLRTKYVPSLIKIHWRMLILECSQGYYGRTYGRTVALLYPFATSLARG